jgi:acetylornithine/succinyldiaminopimelate/putrescine aminotransferase
VTDDLAALFRRHVCQTSATPLGIVVARAAGSTVWDASGRAYLDLLAGMGVANVGHTHPEVVAAVRAQLERHLHVMVYGEAVQETQVRLAQRLAALLPPPLEVVYFTSSGAEAIEGALKTARKHTGRKRLVAFAGGFHGDTLGALSIGGNPLYRTPFERSCPTSRSCRSTTRPRSARSTNVPPRSSWSPCRRRRACASRRRLPRRAPRALRYDRRAARPRRGRDRVRSHRPALRARALGRRADLLVLAKALGGGLPLGAFVGAPAVMATLSHDPPLAHVTTFGGHPVSCAAGLAALEVLVRDRLPARAARLGADLLAQLQRLAGRGGLASARGIGLLLGLEFDTAAHCARFARPRARRGPHTRLDAAPRSVIRLAPPLVLDDGEADEALRRIATALA